MELKDCKIKLYFALLNQLVERSEKQTPLEHAMMTALEHDRHVIRYMIDLIDKTLEEDKHGS